MPQLIKTGEKIAFEDMWKSLPEGCTGSPREDFLASQQGVILRKFYRSFSAIGELATTSGDVVVIQYSLEERREAGKKRGDARAFNAWMGKPSYY